MFENLPARSWHIFSVFGLFAGMQFAFGFIYWTLYKRHRANFSFSGDILSSQNKAVKAILEESIPKRTEGIEGIKEALSEIANGALPTIGKKSATFLLPSSKSCVATWYHGRHGGYLITDITIFDVNQNTLLSGSPAANIVEMNITDPRPEFWPRVLTAHLESQTETLRRDIERLESTLTTAPDVWHYWDFLYFSVIVQTTVGFGDILPNTTIIRLLVAFQIFVGYFILVVALNIVLLP